MLFMNDCWKVQFGSEFVGKCVATNTTQIVRMCRCFRITRDIFVHDAQNAELTPEENH